MLELYATFRKKMPKVKKKLINDANTRVHFLYNQVDFTTTLSESDYIIGHC